MAARHRPVMVHRVILGAIERFLGVLIEHYAGAFPVWLAPVQAMIVTVTDAQLDFARQVCRELRSRGVRAEVDMRSEKLGYKIREAQMQKVPYMLVIGDKEVAGGGNRAQKAGRNATGSNDARCNLPIWWKRSASSPARDVLVWALFERPMAVYSEVKNKL